MLSSGFVSWQIIVGPRQDPEPQELSGKHMFEGFVHGGVTDWSPVPVPRNIEKREAKLFASDVPHLI